MLLFILQPQGLDNPLVVAQIKGLFCPDFEQRSVYPPKKRNRNVSPFFAPKPLEPRWSGVPGFPPPLHGYCCVNGTHPFEGTTRSPNAMSLGPRWCLGRHCVYLCCEGSSPICVLIWCLFPPLQETESQHTSLPTPNTLMLLSTDLHRLSASSL